MRERVGKSPNTVFFQWFVAPEGRKVGSLKRAGCGASWPDEWWKIARRCGAKHISKSKCDSDVEKVHAVVARSTFWSQNVKTQGVRTTFGDSDVEKVHAVVARSTFRSQNVKNTRGSDHFWRFRCRKSARPLWCEAHFEVKMSKTLGVRTTFGDSDVEKVHAVVARSTFRSQNVKNTPCSDHFWKLRCRKSARRCGAKHILKSKCTKHTILGPL